MASILRFGFNIDRDFVIPVYYRFQYVYGVVILGVHVVAFYLLFSHTSIWARGVRAAYLLNQAQMLIHDVWTCFLMRGYTMLPYPGYFCAGPACPILGQKIAFTIENVFMVHSVCILLFMLLIMHQQILPPNSKYVFSRRARLAVIVFLYVSLTLNPISAYLTGSDPPNKEEILNRDDLRWIKQIATSVILLGDIGDCGDYKYAVYIILFSIALIAPLRIFLVGTSISFLKKQVVVTSKAMRMKRLIISVLIKQTACVSLFYIYPLLLNNILFNFQLSFLPDFLLVVVRLALLVSYMLNSAAQFIVMIGANKIFQDVLKAKTSVVVHWCKPERGETTQEIRIATAHNSLSVRGISIQQSS